MGYGIDILNNIRMNASTEFFNNIPAATAQNIISIGNALSTYTTLANEFCEALLNKIGKTIIEQKMFKNKLARFKSGGVVAPHDVEEIFIEMAKNATTYDPQGKNPLGRREPTPVKVVYHRQNRQDCYEISIGDTDFTRVFRNEATLEEFIKRQINSVYSKDEYDEWLCMKNLLARYEQKYFTYDVLNMAEHANKEAFAKDFVKAVRKAVQDVSFLKKDYNSAGVMTKSEPSDLVLLVNKDVLVEVDVERLATAFHQSETDVKVVPTIIAMDDFDSMGNTYALLVDKDFFRVWDTLIHMEPQRNAQGLFTNYFFHHHQILSCSPFKTAVRFKMVSGTASASEE